MGSVLQRAYVNPIKYNYFTLGWAAAAPQRLKF